MTADIPGMDSYWLPMVVSVFLPMLVALATKQLAAGWVKAVTLLALSTVTGLLTSYQAAGDSFDWRAGVTASVISFVTAVAAHFGLWKPVAVTGSGGAIASKVPGGVG